MPDGTRPHASPGHRNGRAGTADGLHCSTNGVIVNGLHIPPNELDKARQNGRRPAIRAVSRTAPGRPLVAVWRQLVESATIFFLGLALVALAKSPRALAGLLWLLRLYPHPAEAKALVVGWLERYLGASGPGRQLLERIAAAHPNQLRRYVARSIMTFLFHDLDTEYPMPNGRKIHAPTAVLITPTQRCPLRCRGCYAGNYSRDDDLPTEVAWRVIEEARALGTHYFVILGGEPMVWDPLWETAGRYSDCVFQFYTSGHLLDRAAAQRIAELGNLLPCISIEGFEGETNWRRGKGGFARAVAAMDALRAENVLFAYSATVTHRNVAEVTSDDFADFMIDRGAVVGWHFLYMPVGFHPDLSLMPTAEDRNVLRRRINEIRNSRPLLTADFWGDGPLTEGCLAAGRRYLHVNNYGDVEPCIFLHFATHNIKECSLAEALASDFFQAFQRSAPWSTNLLRPCPIIDHPQVLRGLVQRYNAHGTHRGADSVLKDEQFVRHLDAYSKTVEQVFDPVFGREYRWVAKLLGKPRYDWSSRTVDSKPPATIGPSGEWAAPEQPQPQTEGVQRVEATRQ